MIISENGLALHDVDTLLECAMQKYWLEKSVNGKWHLIWERDNLNSYVGRRAFREEKDDTSPVLNKKSFFEQVICPENAS